VLDVVDDLTAQRGHAIDYFAGIIVGIGWCNWHTLQRACS
jgi:hypothetical protein